MTAAAVFDALGRYLVRARLARTESGLNSQALVALRERVAATLRADAGRELSLAA